MLFLSKRSILKRPTMCIIPISYGCVFSLSHRKKLLRVKVSLLCFAAFFKGPLFSRVHTRGPPFSRVHTRGPPFSRVHTRGPPFSRVQGPLYSRVRVRFFQGSGPGPGPSFRLCLLILYLDLFCLYDFPDISHVDSIKEIILSGGIGFTMLQSVRPAESGHSSCLRVS